MMISRNITCCIVVLVSLVVTVAQVCENVYPQLSCGLTHSDESSCITAGCCWDGMNCFAPKIYGYEYKPISNENGVMTGSLLLNEPSGLKFGSDFMELDMQVIQETAARTHIKISTTGETRWEIPDSILPRPGGVYTDSDPLTKTIIKPQNDDDSYNNMEILISRLNHGHLTSDVIFAFTKMLVFQDQYVQLVLGVPSSTTATYGFGESTRHTQKLTYNSTYTLWNTDQGSSNFDQSLYGSHPFYIQVAANGKAHGVLFLNTNAMDVTLTESMTQGNTIGIQSTGGIIDLYIFAGPTPNDVIKQYLEVIGKPAMIPYWALGFHNCRWGYENIEYVEDVVANYSIADIPLETQWVDIDYMDKFLDFTLDPIHFPYEKMSNFVNNLHQKNQYFIPIVDPAIYILNSNYSTYNNGIKLNIFIKDLTGNTEYLSQVWPGATYFPDWFSSNAQLYWNNEMNEFYNLVAYDGIWIDMNEASNFCNADGNAQICEFISQPCNTGCITDDGCIVCSIVDPNNKYDFPPFVPHVVWGSLSGKTIAMSGLHASNVLEYNAHNLYGMMESMTTRTALLNIRPTERPFVLSRSTTMGSGKYAAHWTGDNAATWDDLKASITTMNNLALFGISITGADICGFNGATNEELCARWIEVGAFSPFSRDHNAIGQPPQELYRWDSVAEASRKSLALRYQLLPYLYTLTYKAHVYGDLLMCGLWVNYPSDPITLTQDTQYMWSDALLFTPVLEAGAISVTGYFPRGIWYSLTDDSVIDASAIGTFLELPTELTSTNVHVRGGHIIPMQESAMTTAAARATPFTLLVALDKEGMAAGSLYLDDGVQEKLEKVTTITYHAEDSVLTSTLGERSYMTKTVLGAVEVRGITTGVNRHSKSIPTCTALLSVLSHTNSDTTTTTKDVVLQVIPSVEFIQREEYASVVFSFNTTDASSITIMENFQLSWKCI